MLENKRSTAISAPSRFHSVLFRLILTFTMILIPIVVMGLTIYQVGVNRMDRQITLSLNQQVDFKIQELESQMRLAQEQMNQLSEEKDILQLSGRYAMMSDYEQVDQLNRLQERMATIRNANSFVKQIEVYLPGLGRSLRAISWAVDESVILDLDEEKFERMWKLSAKQPNQVFNDQGRLYYVSQQPILLSIGMKKRPRLLCAIEYDLNAITKHFANILPDLQVGSALLFADGTVMGDGLDGELQSQLKARVGQQGAEQDEREISWRDGQYYVISRYSPQLGARYVLYASRIEAFSELNEFKTFLIVLLILFVVAMMIYGVRAYMDVHTPLKLLTGAFDRLAWGDMDFQVQYDKPNEFQYLTERFNLTLLKLKETVSLLYHQRILMQQAQIKQLQAQINPHFLYNSFFILDNMIAMEDYEAASLFSRRLGQYFRYVTRDARDTVFLSEELDHARSYVEVQRIRFGRRMDILFPENPFRAAQVQVPRLTLQPILENAFVHSLEKAEHGRLEVRVMDSGTEMTVEVENTGFQGGQERLNQLMARLEDDSPEQEITGLMNVHRRLKLTQKTGLAMRLTEEDTLIVTVRLKMEGA
jgi:two-component system sensor histidine kinase YesM